MLRVRYKGGSMRIQSIAITLSVGIFGFFCIAPVYAAPVPLRQEVRQELGTGSREAMVKKFIGTRAQIGKGTVTSKTSDSLGIKDQSGKELAVKFDSKTQFRRRFWGKSSIDEVQVGHDVAIIGKWLDDAQSQIQAVLIRDVSIQKRNGVFFGNVTLVSSTGFVMATKARGNQTVTVSTTTRMINRIGATIGQSTIAVGHRIRVIGLWDSKANTVTEVTQVKDFDLP